MLAAGDGVAAIIGVIVAWTGLMAVPGVWEEEVSAVGRAGVAFACGWSAMQPADITRSAARSRKIPLRFMGIIVFISPGP